MKDAIVSVIRRKLEQNRYGKGITCIAEREEKQKLLEELRAVEKLPSKTINIIAKYLAFIWGISP